MRRWLTPGLLACLALAPGLAADPIPPGQEDELRALIKPSAREERWSRIPWLADLWAARQKAAREGKPILLWEMDGHPLGCT
jgi:hypothetical protein